MLYETTALSDAEMFMRFLERLKPRHPDLEFIIAVDHIDLKLKLKLGLLIRTEAPPENFYCVLSEENMNQVCAEDNINLGAYDEAMILLPKIRHFSDYVVSNLQRIGASFTQDLIRLIPHGRTGREIVTGYSWCPDEQIACFGFSEVSARLVGTNKEAPGPFRSIPINDSGPLSLTELFGQSHLTHG